MFNIVVKYLGFLKHIPGVGFLFDSWLKIWALLTNPALLDYVDDIERQISQWDGVSIGLHKYGGVQFNYRNCEIGHIHSNGLLDMLLNRKLKQQLMQEGKILDHHVFKDTGWISFYIRTDADRDYALRLLKLSYQFQQQKESLSPGRYHQTPRPAIVTVLT
jgi:hypothetical protein